MTIKDARIASGLSQVKLSNLLGIPLLTLQFYEEGHRKCRPWLEQLLVAAIEKGEPIEEHEEFATIKEARKAKGWTQAQLHAALGIPSRTIESWDAGERQPTDWCRRLVIDNIVKYEEIKEYDKVKLVKPFNGLQINTEGAVVLEYDGTAFEVEFFDESGETIEVLTVPTEYLKIVK